MLLRTPAKGVVPLLAGSLLAGCLTVRTPAKGEPLRLEPGEGLVLGRVRIFEQGRELHPWRVEFLELLAEDPLIAFALLQVESGRKRPGVPLDEEGRFAWILPAGTYLLYHTPSVDPPVNEPLAAFQVPSTSEVLDLGELALDVAVDRSLGPEPAAYQVTGTEALRGDREVERWFLETHPGALDVRTGHLVVDPALGSLFGHWSVEACARVLARHGLEVGRER